MTMTNTRSKFSILLFCAMLLSPLSVAAATYSIELSEWELAELSDNPSQKYVSLDKQISNIARIVEYLHSLENNPTSPIGQLHKHMQDGFSIGLQQEIVAALQYGQEIVTKQKRKLSAKTFKNLSGQLDSLINELNNGSLTLDSNDIINKSHCHQLPIVYLHKGLTVAGKAKFKCEVELEHSLEAQKATFNKTVHFKKNIVVDGTASIN